MIRLRAQTFVLNSTVTYTRPSAQIAPLLTPVVPVTHEQEFLDVAADALFEIDEEQGLHKVMSLAPSLK